MLQAEPACIVGQPGRTARHGHEHGGARHAEAWHAGARRRCRAVPRSAAVPPSRPGHGPTRAPACRAVPLGTAARQARAAAAGADHGGEDRRSRTGDGWGRWRPLAAAARWARTSCGWPATRRGKGKGRRHRGRTPAAPRPSWRPPRPRRGGRAEQQREGEAAEGATAASGGEVRARGRRRDPSTPEGGEVRARGREEGSGAADPAAGGSGAAAAAGGGAARQRRGGGEERRVACRLSREGWEGGSDAGVHGLAPC